MNPLTSILNIHINQINELYFLQEIEEYEFLRRASDNDTLQKTPPLGDKGNKLQPQQH